MILLTATLMFSSLAPVATDTLRHSWSVPASWEVEAQEVSFESHGVVLSGTLLSPRGIEDAPAVVFVQQAGMTTRDNPLHEQMAKVFNAIGYAAFLYDRRGHGESEGDPARPRFRTMAEDAVAAMRAIGATAAVDSDRIGFWGISQGGWLAMEAASLSDPAFVISLSAPLTTPGEQMDFLAHNYVRVHAGEAAAERALAARRIVMGDYYRGQVPYEAARDTLAALEAEAWFEHTFMPAAQDLPRDMTESSWIHEMAYEPLEYFRSMTAPLLFILGGEDMDIPVARTLEIIEELPSRDETEVVVIPGANHVLRIGHDPLDQRDLSQDRLIANSDKLFMIMGRWLGELDN